MFKFCGMIKILGQLLILIKNRNLIVIDDDDDGEVYVEYEITFDGPLERTRCCHDYDCCGNWYTGFSKKILWIIRKTYYYRCV